MYCYTRPPHVLFSGNLRVGRPSLVAGGTHTPCVSVLAAFATGWTNERHRMVLSAVTIRSNYRSNTPVTAQSYCTELWHRVTAHSCFTELLHRVMPQGYCKELWHGVTAQGYGTGLLHRVMAQVTAQSYGTGLLHRVMAQSYCTELWHRVTAQSYGTELVHKVMAQSYGT